MEISPSKLARLIIPVVVSVASGSWCSVARADAPFFGSPLDDLKLYVTAPLRWDEEDWLYFGGALAAIAGSHALDSRVRTHFATGSNATSFVRPAAVMALRATPESGLSPCRP